MIERLETLEKRYKHLNEEMLKEEVYSDFNKMKQYNKEKIDLEKIMNCYYEYKQILEDIDAAKEMAGDPELMDFAHEELEKLHNEKNEYEDKLTILLLPKDPNDEKNVIVEIRGAAGGDEANLFCGDLYRMYIKYAEQEGWSLEVLNESEGTSGGFSQVEFMLKGEAVYSKLKFESGSHRVQRVPETESQGRIHTSTATVLVMPEAEEVDIEINPSDLKIDVYRSSGAGGQHVNTTDSAVRITYLPTGLVVTCQNERSQIKNKEKALISLKARLYEEKTREKEEQEGKARKSKIGTGDRSEKIRTYNYPQNRLTDHRINYTVMHLDKIMEGYLDEVIEALITEDIKRKIESE